MSAMNSLLRTIVEIHNEIETAERRGETLSRPTLTFSLGDLPNKVVQLRNALKAKSLVLKSNNDEYLMRFLLARSLDVESSIKLALAYESFLRMNTELTRLKFKHVENLLKSGTLNVLEYRDKRRRIVWLRPGQWNPSTFPIEDAFLAGIVGVEPLSLEPETQAAGVVVLLDLKNLSSEQLKPLTKSFLRKLHFFISSCLPVRIETVHLLNVPALLSVVLSIFLSVVKGKFDHKIHLHGRTYKGIEKHISMDILPTELGGNYSHTADPWLCRMKSYSTTMALQELGYELIRD